MTSTFKLSASALETLFAALSTGGWRILGPTENDGRVEVREVKNPSQVASQYLQSTLSAKEVAFPKVERLLSYKMTPGQVELQDHDPELQPTVLFGARPCEAAGFGVLDKVFNWDSRDKLFSARMRQLTVIGLSCTQADDACFCTSVGGGPGATKGSDLLLTPLPAGGYLAEVLTAKGEALQALVPAVFEPAEGVDKEALLAKVEPAFDRADLSAKLPGLFTSDLWAEQSLRCLGCGACAFVCPTCACFDIQEEADTKQGQRLRLWDSCGLRQFTLHASGHNPRNVQAERWRQRIYHKFSYFPQRFGEAMCVGCGKCTRACPVDMNLKEHLTQASGA
ncbi:MAG: 4Fe-4S dicluster domain-containing protein [Candidatus Competibacter sp.]|jgi:sulfhydrogenase subunit beta (sulfur reductase)